MLVIPELPRGLVRHTEPLVDFLRRPYTEDNPYYLFQHDLLESMPELQGFFREPEAIPEFPGRPIVSVGKDGSGLPFHEHAQTWSDLAIGRKRWALYHATQHPLPKQGFSPMETQVQWLLGANYTDLTEAERPLECIQEPGDVVYLPDGWLHATVSIGPTVAFTRNSYDSTVLPPPLGHYYHLDQFAIAVGKNEELPALKA